MDDDKLFGDFLCEIQKEISYHSNGGTTYRQRTSELSFEIASKTGSIMPFLNRDQARQIVIRTLPELGMDQVEDTAKMLNVLARDVLKRTSLPNFIKGLYRTKTSESETNTIQKKAI